MEYPVFQGMDAEAIQDKLSVDTYNFTQTVYDIRSGEPVITHSKYFDATFTHHAKNNEQSFASQAIMGALSDVHYGNPTSSISYVLAHWRRAVSIGLLDSIQQTKRFKSRNPYVDASLGPQTNKLGVR